MIVDIGDEALIATSMHTQPHVFMIHESCFCESEWENNKNYSHIHHGKESENAHNQFTTKLKWVTKSLKMELISSSSRGE